MSPEDPTPPVPVSLRPANACAWCGRRVMHYNACPNAKDICTDCCGED